MLEFASTAGRSLTRTSAETEALIEQLRRLRMTGPLVAEKLDMALSTVTAVLKRIGLNRLSKLEQPEPTNRYCRRHLGELIHIDIKKLGRFNKPGHRVAYIEVLPDQKAATCIGFLDRAIAWFAAHGKAERFMHTMLREWAYAAVYQSSDQRREALEPWLWRYNNQRLHNALGHKTPISRLHHEDD